MNYSKPPLSISDQITKLEERGLIIDDIERAKKYLSHIGYYRLSAYFIPFEQLTVNDSRSHEFLPDTLFQKILELYIFDRKLRLLIMEAIERIEVSVRTCWAGELALRSNNSHAYMDAQLFADPWKHQIRLARVSKELHSSKEICVKHYKEKYTQPYLPPVWAMVETLSFGSLSSWVASTKNNEIKTILAHNLGLPTAAIMEKVLHVLTYIRNLCAHHARVWNRKMTLQLPSIRRFDQDLITDSTSINGRQLTREIYNYLIILIQIMQNIQPNTTWVKRLKLHIETLNDSQYQSMGFPLDWQNKSIWQS